MHVLTKPIMPDCSSLQAQSEYMYKSQNRAFFKKNDVSEREEDLNIHSCIFYINYQPKYTITTISTVI